jgi:hypothetical protein
MTEYIIYNKEKEGSQKAALVSGNYSLADVGVGDINMFRQMSNAFSQEAEWIAIEELEVEAAEETVVVTIGFKQKVTQPCWANVEVPVSISKDKEKLVDYIHDLSNHHELDYKSGDSFVDEILIDLRVG